MLIKTGKIGRKVSFLLVIAMLFSSAVSTVRAETVDSADTTFVINEYDMYLELQECNDEDLVEKGYTEEEIYVIKNELDDVIEERLIKRAALSEETLAAYGYTSAEIAKLKEIDRTKTVNLTEAELRGLAGKCYGKINPISASDSEFRVEYRWNWDPAPFVCYKDSVAMRWEAIAIDGEVVDTYAGYLTSAFVNYYDSLDGFSEIRKLEPINDLDFNTVKFNILMTDVGDETIALDGSVSLQIQRQPYLTRSIQYVKFSALYGHTILNIGFPSLSADDKGGIGMSFSGGLNTDNVAGEKCIIDIYKNKTPIKG